ncbi:MAG: hypothetical protein ACYCVL_06365 [Gemmatimonadaceae bacterium]
MSARRGLLFGALLTAACFHHAPLAKVDNPNVITESEIRRYPAASIYDVIAQLRPEFLRDRGRISLLTDTHDVATVFLNDVEYGQLADMKTMPAAEIAEVRFYSGIDAVIKFGRHYGSGVIQLISRNH